MRAVVFHGPGQKHWEEVPDPKIVDESASRHRTFHRWLRVRQTLLVRRRVACRVPPLGAHGALLRAGCLLPEQERQQHEAAPGGHVQDLVQV